MHKKKSFREIDHSGDVGIEAWGGTVAEVFENTAAGLLALMVDGEVGISVERCISVTSGSEEDLLVDFLSEIIASASLLGEVYSLVRVTSTGRYFARAVICGQAIADRACRLRFEVKAATYHELVFEQTAEGFHARVVFDL